MPDAAGDDKHAGDGGKMNGTHALKLSYPGFKCDVQN